MEWESIDSVGNFGGILFMWNSHALSALEVIKGNFSLSILFRWKDGEIFWMTGIVWSS